MKKQYVIISWILRILVSLGFLLASYGKLANDPGVIAMFEAWGYPQGFHFFIGLFELAMAIQLLIPATLKYALLGISIVMIGAIGTHLLNDPIVEVIRPLIFLLLTGLIYFLNFRMRKNQDI